MARQRRYRRDNSSFDEEEEMWFEKEDEPTEAASVDAAGNKTPPFDHAAADEVAMEDNVAPWLAMPTKPLIKGMTLCQSKEMINVQKPHRIAPQNIKQ